MQLARIEHRKAHLRRLHQNLPSEDSCSHSKAELGALDPTQHHHIGVSENLPEHIGTFLRNHSSDPAIKVFTFFIMLIRLIVIGDAIQI